MIEEPVPSSRGPRPAFAHASEAELARILTYYDVRWEYEPDTFPISWTLDGEVVESFSPDFYLPDLDLYVELTTLKQSLVRKKNRKLRRLRELYPDVRIKLFYARDFRMLLLKFGRLALAEELSGTTGQATPPRAPSPGAASALPGASGTGDASAASRSPDGAAGRRAPEPSSTGDAAPAAGEADDAVGSAASAALLAADADAGRTPRGRRRGRRRRAAARSAAQSAEAPTHPAGAAPRGQGPVPSAGTRPA